MTKISDLSHNTEVLLRVQNEEVYSVPAMYL